MSPHSRTSWFLGVVIVLLTYIHTVLVPDAEPLWALLLLFLVLPVTQTARAVLQERRLLTPASPLTARTALRWAAAPAYPLILATFLFSIVVERDALIYRRPGEETDALRLWYTLVIYQILLVATALWAAVHVNRIVPAVCLTIAAVLAYVGVAYFFPSLMLSLQWIVPRDPKREWFNWVSDSFELISLLGLPLMWIVGWTVWLNQRFVETVRERALSPARFNWRTVFPLLKRESRLQPWHLGLIISCVFALQLLLQGQVHFWRMNYGPRRFTFLNPYFYVHFFWPTPILSIITVWAVAAALQRETTPGARAALVLAPIGERGLAVCKTFGSTWFLILLLLITHTAGEVSFAWNRDIVRPQPPDLPQIVWYSLLTVPFHLVFTLCLATFACRVGARLRSPLRITASTLAVGFTTLIGCVITLTLLNHASDEMLSRESAVLESVIFLLGWFAITVAPLLWLIHWWRWTATGFRRDYVGE